MKKLIRSRLLIVVIVVLGVIALLAVALSTEGGPLSGTALLYGTPSEVLPGGPIETAARPTSTPAILEESTPISLPATLIAELPTAMPEPLTATPEPPTATPEPPTATPEPPTATPVPRQAVRPILECVVPYGSDYMAYFGYENPNLQPVTIPVGAENQFAPGAADQGQPTVFQPGRSAAWPAGGFGVAFSGDSLVWSLDGATAQAAPDSPLCAYEIRIEDMWYDAAGNLLDGPPAGLPPGFTITAQSDYGSATCSYAGGAELTCRYDNRARVAGDGVLWVPANGVYAVSEVGLPPGWQVFAGIGFFPARGSARSFTHIVDNRAPGAPGATATPIPLTATPRWIEASPAPPASATPTETATPLPPSPAPTAIPTAEAPTAAPPTATATPLIVAEEVPAAASPTAISAGGPAAVAVPTTAPVPAAPAAPDRSPLVIGLLLLALGAVVTALILYRLRSRAR